MREILFRGKRVDNGEWVYGDLLTPTDIMDVWEISENTGMGDRYEIDPETVGQYTGLKDRNGNKIFEGDILRGYQYPYLSGDNFNYYAEVIYFDNCSAFGTYTFKNPNLNVVRGISAGNTALMEDWESENWEVIGNIYDNPELLEVEK